jgi:hypothetical protein
MGGQSDLCSRFPELALQCRLTTTVDSSFESQTAMSGKGLGGGLPRGKCLAVMDGS